MDGTMIDSEPIYEEISKEIYDKYGIELTEEDKERHLGSSLKDIWTDILEHHEVDEEFSHYKREDFMEDHIHSSYQGLAEAEDLQLIPGLEEWLEFFKDHGYKMIIASSSYEPVIEHVYQRFGLEEYMEGYVDGNAVENGKPEPDIFIRAAEKMGLSPAECIIIEDSKKGVEGAAASGAKVVAFTGNSSSTQDLSAADYIIDEYNQENLNKIIK